jgi:hypothetical protein
MSFLWRAGGKEEGMDNGSCTCKPDPLGIVKKVTMPDGLRVGIFRLELILEEVAGMGLADTKAIKAALIDKARMYNYIASCAELDYSIALFGEYTRRFGK